MIPTVDITFLSSVFPEFGNVPPSVILALNAPGANYIDECFFGDASQWALALWIAHTLSQSATRGGGSVTEDHIGDLSTSYAALEGKTSLELTTYGMRLLELGRMLGASAGMFVTPGCSVPPPFGGFQPTWTNGIVDP